MNTARLAILLPPLLLSCDRVTPSSAGPESTAVTYHQHVRPLMETSCVSCHLAGGIAPFALTSFEAAYSARHRVAAAVEERVMPPYLAGPGCADYADDERLSEEQLALVRRWVDEGGLEGDPSTAPVTEPPAGGLSRVDLRLELPVEYAPRLSPDDYRCFLLDWPAQADQYVTGFKANPGNARIVHHVIAFLIPPDRTAEYEGFDAAEPGPGYTCFGGPGGSGRGVAWLGSWAPGGRGEMYPQDTGLLVRPGSKVALQVHYNVEGRAGETDRTSVDLALSDSVRRRAAILPWADFQWVLGQGMLIPAGESEVTHSFWADPTLLMGFVTNGAMPSGTAFKIHSVALHMHLLGTGGRLEIQRAGGERECLLDIPRWDFHWQRGYALARARVLRPGDQLGISCRWDNSVENQPHVNGAQLAPRDVQWGEGSADEMCLGILYVSE